MKTLITTYMAVAIIVGCAYGILGKNSPEIQNFEVSNEIYFESPMPTCSEIKKRNSKDERVLEFYRAFSCSNPGPKRRGWCF